MMRKIECDRRKGVFYVQEAELWIKEDPCQILDLISCTVQTGFEIESSTENAIIENASLLKALFPEEKNQEIVPAS